MIDYGRRQPLVPLAVAFMAGLFTASAVRPSLALVVTGTAALLFVTWLTRWDCGWLGVFFALGLLRLTLVENPPATDLKYRISNSSWRGYFRGVVEQIDVIPGRKPRLKCRVFQLDHWETTGRILLRWPKGDFVPQLGDTVEGAVELRPPRPAAFPGDFNEVRWLEREGIGAVGRPLNREGLVVIPASSGNSARWSNTARRMLQAALLRYVVAPEGEVLSALLLGLRREVDPQIVTDFRRTGTLHVLAVSGLHVGFVTLIFMVIAGFLRLPRQVKIGFSLLGLAGYVWLVGGMPSVKRAALMAGLYLWGTVRERRAEALNFLAAAALIILLLNPKEITGLGFQLSFGAVAGLVILYPFLRNNLAPIFKRSPKPVRWFLESLLVTTAAQLGTFPFLVWNFHRLPLTGFILNPIVVPAIGLIVALGVLVLLAAPWWAWAASAWGTLAWWIIHYTLKVIHWGAALEGAVLNFPREKLWLVFTVWLSLCLLWWPGVKRKGFWLLCLWLGAGNLMVWGALVQGPTRLKLHWLKFRRGAVFLVEEPEGPCTVLWAAGERDTLGWQRFLDGVRGQKADRVLFWSPRHHPLPNSIRADRALTPRNGQELGSGAGYQWSSPPVLHSGVSHTSWWINGTQTKMRAVAIAYGSTWIIWSDMNAIEDVRNWFSESSRATEVMLFRMNEPHPRLEWLGTKYTREEDCEVSEGYVKRNSTKSLEAKGWVLFASDGKGFKIINR